MNESKSTETKKKVSRKVTKRQRNLRNTIMMAGLSVVLLSGATYAWFTLSNTAKITNLSLGVAKSSGLLIAPANDNGDVDSDNYGTILELEMTNEQAVLLPATLADLNGNNGTNYVMCKPIYAGEEGKVTLLSEITASDKVLKDSDVSGDAASEGYYYEKDFYLRVNADGTYDITLKAGTFEDNKATGGTYVGEKNDNGASQLSTEEESDADTLPAASAIRIAFYTVSGNTESIIAVYEPNINYVKTGKASSIAGIGYQDQNYSLFNIQSPGGSIVAARQSVDGKFIHSSTGTSNDSDVLFTMSGGQDNHYRMKVWIEGTDAQCYNEIALNSILGQIQFESTKVESGGN